MSDNALIFNIKFCNLIYYKVLIKTFLPFRFILWSHININVCS